MGFVERGGVFQTESQCAVDGDMEGPTKTDDADDLLLEKHAHGDEERRDGQIMAQVVE